MAHALQVSHSYELQATGGHAGASSVSVRLAVEPGGSAVAISLVASAGPRMRVIEVRPIDG